MLPSAADELVMVDAEGARESHSMATKPLEHIKARLHSLLVKDCYTIYGMLL